MGGSRTTTGAVVFPRWKPSLSLRFSPLVPVRPGKTTVRRVIRDPPMAGLLLFIFKLLFLENYKKTTIAGFIGREKRTRKRNKKLHFFTAVYLYVYLELTSSFMKWNWKKKIESGVLEFCSRYPESR